MPPLQFYARIYDVDNTRFIDAQPQLYSIGLCTETSWPRPYSYASVYGTKVHYWERQYNNIWHAITDYLNAGELGRYVRFCLTKDPDDNYFFFDTTGPHEGGYVCHGRVHNYIFGSAGSLTGKMAVLSSYDLSPTTKTGNVWLSGDYYLVASNTLGYDSTSFEDFKILLSMSTTDPYNSGGQTTPGGGDGDFDDSSDSINIPNLPAITVSNTGFITLFNPSTADLQNLAEYMWSNLFDLNGWKKIFADPMDAILGLSIVPVTVDSSGRAAVTVGNISTGITMPLVVNQFVTVDCGSITVSEYWGAYLDYAPYTKAEIYLPYCGIHPIDIDDIMGKTVNVVYHVDILSGACCAYIKSGGSILYTFIGQCSSSIPITGDNWTNVINGVLSAAVSVGSMMTTGGATAGREAPKLAANVINNFKPSIAKSGAMGGTGGMLAYQKPYLIITRPRQALPKDQNSYTGYPSYITVQLNTVTGYTEVEKIHLDYITATESELREIEELLRNGVIF